MTSRRPSPNEAMQKAQELMDTPLVDILGDEPKTLETIGHLHIRNFPNTAESLKIFALSITPNDDPVKRLQKIEAASQELDRKPEEYTVRDYLWARMHYEHRIPISSAKGMAELEKLPPYTQDAITDYATTDPIAAADAELMQKRYEDKFADYLDGLRALEALASGQTITAQQKTLLPNVAKHLQDDFSFIKSEYAKEQQPRSAAAHTNELEHVVATLRARKILQNIIGGNTEKAPGWIPGDLITRINTVDPNTAEYHDVIDEIVELEREHGTISARTFKRAAEINESIREHANTPDRIELTVLPNIIGQLRSINQTLGIPTPNNRKER